MNKKDIAFIFDILDKMYPDAETELNYSTDFQLLIAVIMSAQATDKQVNKITDKLYKIVKKPEDVINM
jgi:endonuclease-3